MGIKKQPTCSDVAVKEKLTSTAVETPEEVSSSLDATQIYLSEIGFSPLPFPLGINLKTPPSNDINIKIVM